MRTRLALVLCLMSAACGSAASRTPVADPATKTVAPGIDIRKASMPFKVLRTRGGQEIATDAFLGELEAAAAICIGESHNNPHHHWVQLHLVEAMSERKGSKVLALGMEMFQLPFQGVLDDYAAGRIDEDALLVRSGWDERWGFDFALYQPIITKAVASGMALVALNIANELRRKISRQGIDSLTDAERSSLPELDLEDEEHKAWFDGLMADMGGHGHGEAEPGGHKAHGHHGAGVPPSLYLAQVLWDESMAETAAGWLAAGTGRQILILAGNGHCHDTAIVKRMRRRGAGTVVSVRPVVDDGKGNVAAELARPMTDYLVVMSPER